MVDYEATKLAEYRQKMRSAGYSVFARKNPYGGAGKVWARNLEEAQNGKGVEYITRYEMGIEPPLDTKETE